MFDLDGYFRALATELQDLQTRNLLPPTAFSDKKWNRQSRLHARIFGAMVRAVERPLVPMVEMKWDGGFCPDVVIVDEHDRVQAVMEYESTNSSDERMFDKDLLHFEGAILAKPEHLPPWWVLISTLPEYPVSGWKWYGYNTDIRYPPASKCNKTRQVNPLAYYEAGMHDYLAQMWRRIATAFEETPPTNVAWVNMQGVDNIQLKNLNGRSV